MRITVSYLSDQITTEYMLPDGVEGTIDIKQGEGLDGNIVLIIIQIAERALNSAASIAAIASFIYMITCDKRKVKTVIEGNLVPEPTTKAMIQQQITQRKKDE